MDQSQRPCIHPATGMRATFAPHPLAAAIAAALVTMPAAVWAQLPTGGVVVNGTAGIATNGSVMTITNSPNAILNWKSFSIGAQNGVRFDQQNAASQVLNRVVGNDPSAILGSLSSNGGVWLLNPNGVLFGSTARIDVAHLVATTLNISNDDFLNNRYRFDSVNPLGGQVLNQGEINTTFGGRVWLLGDSVRNEGLVRSPGGNIVLAAGKSVELIDSGMPNVTVRLTAPANEAVNLGSLIANANGSIDVHGGIVNQQGIIRADSIGTDAAGRVVLRAQGDVTLGDASVTSASAGGSGAAGRLLVESVMGTTSVTGKVSATSTGGSGGQVQVLGHNVGVFRQAEVDASGGAGGGEVLLGGDYQGKNAAVPNASATYLGPDAVLRANASAAGDGGKVIVWGNDASRVYGTIEARGGPLGGNGGFVETSGGYLDAQPRNIDLGAPAGQPGTWLLDPYDITIAGGQPVETFVAVGDAVNYQVTSAQDNSVIAASRINEQLGRGTNVIVSTGTAPGSTQAGNITVAANIKPSVPPAPPPPVLPPPPAGSPAPTPAPTPAPAVPVSAAFTLRAHNDIIVQAGVSIQSDSGPMPVTFIADSDNNGAGRVIMQPGSLIRTSNGAIQMTATGIQFSGTTLDAGAATINLTGKGTGAGTGVFMTSSQLASTSAGDAITVVADRFTNTGSTFSTPAGRWLVYLGPAQPSTFLTDLGGLDYQFVQFNAPFSTTPALSGAGQHGVLLADPLNVQVKVNATRPYDGTVLARFDSALSSNAPAGFTVQTIAPGLVDGTFVDKNAGLNKAINFTGTKFALRTSTAKPVFGSTLSYIGDITGANLTYVADPAVRGTGFPITGLTGSITGFIGTDNLANATTGTPAWVTDATPASPPGLYAINGTGLTAPNYVLTQAPGNATALTLKFGNLSGTPPGEVIASIDSSLDRNSRFVLASISRPMASSLFDISGPTAQSCFAPVNISMLDKEALNRMIECRKDFKRKLFAEADYKLELDPTLADVPLCTTAAEASSGMCRITSAQLDELQARQPRVTAEAPRRKTASLPQIERKIAVLIGINDYADKKIPRLVNAVPDVEAVAKIFTDKLGYETRVIRNPNKADIIRTLNQLSTEVQAPDSVVVYYAGHGYSLAKNPAGYWLPADAPVNDPTRWISNSDIAKLLAGLRSKQMAVISDSCYSGAFAREGMESVGRGVPAEEVLTKRSVIVMSSGGDEPVTDEGKDGHSIFAWNLMKAMNEVQNWRPGSTVYDEVQLGVTKEFPQTPKYGSVTAAGHQPGGDYLFEFR